MNCQYCLDMQVDGVVEPVVSIDDEQEGGKNAPCRDGTKPTTGRSLAFIKALKRNCRTVGIRDRWCVHTIVGGRTGGRADGSDVYREWTGSAQSPCSASIDPHVPILTILPL